MQEVINFLVKKINNKTISLQDFSDILIDKNIENSIKFMSLLCEDPTIDRYLSSFFIDKKYTEKELVRKYGEINGNTLTIYGILKNLIKEEIIDSLGEMRSYNYLYVTHRADGMVITVGKSSSNDIFLDGDLFYQLNTNHLSGTENIILRTEYGNEIFAKYDEILKNYLDWAWIIPVESGDAKKLERLLGDELINKKVPILNYYSHRQ